MDVDRPLENQPSIDYKKSSAVQQLNREGFNLIIPDRFKALSLEQLGVGTPEVDRLSGIGVETDEVRTKLVEKVTDCVKKDKPFLHIHADADSLKAANAIGRWLGDLDIQWTISQVVNTVDFLTQNGKQIQVFVIRPSKAADEVEVWCFAEKPEDINNIKLGLHPLDDQAKITETETKELGFEEIDFALSWGIVTTSDKNIAQEIEATRKFLETNPDKLAYDFYQRITESVDKQAQFFKAVKEITKIPSLKEWIKMDMSEFITLTARVHGEGRIGINALELLMQLASLKAYFQGGKELIDHLPEGQKNQLNFLVEKLGAIESLSQRGLSDVGAVFDKTFSK